MEVSHRMKEKIFNRVFNFKFLSAKPVRPMDYSSHFSMI